MDIELEALRPYVSFATSRSGGSGGQNVNKVETKVTLYFDLESYPAFSEQQKMLLRHRLATRIQADGRCTLSCQRYRSQLENKRWALNRLKALLLMGLAVPKTRKATRPANAVFRKRRQDKMRQSAKKADRRHKDE